MVASEPVLDFPHIVLTLSLDLHHDTLLPHLQRMITTPYLQSMVMITTPITTHLQGMISEFRRASAYARAGGIRGDTRDPSVFRRVSVWILLGEPWSFLISVRAIFMYSRCARAIVIHLRY
jgi:hypothetical protein